jgi:mono/diheme cytochrome c family protein
MRRSSLPVEQRPYGIFFILASAFLAVGTIWAVVDETWLRRPWKEYQEEFRQLELHKAEEALAQWQRHFETPEVQAEFRDLESQLEAAEKKLASQEYKNAVAELHHRELALQELTQQFQFAKSESDELYYEYKKAFHEGVQKDDVKARLEKLEVQLSDFSEQIKTAEAEKQRAQTRVKELRDEAGRLREALSNHTAERERLHRKIEAVKKRPPEVKQIILEYFDKNNFGNPVARVDRCATCHLGIANPDFEDAPQPFTRHSYIIQYHPVEKFGCTVCHGGQGVALKTSAAHGTVEFWENPLLPNGDRERLCGKCHQEAIEIPEAPTLTEGRKLFETYGCLGCHNVENYIKVPNIGPPLDKIYTKVKPDWLRRWILDPKKYLSKTKMPNFRFSEEEARAIQAYLLRQLHPRVNSQGEAKSEKRESEERRARNEKLASRSPLLAPRSTPDEKLAEEGRLIFGMARCVSCHALDGIGGAIGPDLGKIASKARPEWLYEWVKNPQAYQPNTKMPRYRFSERELNALIAYLSTLGADDAAGNDEALPDFTDEERRTGKKLMDEYGCLGCHDPVGQELVGGKVGADLTTFGEKSAEALDFGDVLNIERSLSAWVQAKLQNPRVFSTERIQLKMPDFGFSPEQARALSTVLLSFTEETVPDAYFRKRPLNNGYNPPGDFGRIVREVNCLTCHKINGRGGDLAPDLSYEGSRANAAWLRKYLKEPYTLRPTLVERMPKFHLADEEIDTIVNYMKTTLLRDDVPTDLLNGQRLTEAEIQEGKRLYEEKYQCRNCHQINYEGGTMGPELISSDTSIKERRTPGWIYAWIKNPKALDPKTKEPVLGLSDEEALLITKYLLAASEGRVRK